MALKFKDLNIPGTNSRPMLAPPQPMAVRDVFPGVRGSTEIRHEYGGRPIGYMVLLYDKSFQSAADVVKALQKFDQKVNTNGTLEELGNVPRKFHDVTFEGCTPLDDVRQDIAGTLIRGRNVYFVPVSLQFFQLSVEQD